MLRVQIDTDRCNGCGECAKDCPRMLIALDHEKKAVFDAEKNDVCIGCQHCLAVCKPGAIRVDNVDPDTLTPLKNNLPSLEQMQTFVAGRRTTRRYKDEQVDKELIHQLLAATANAPTGVNSMQTMLTVVDDIASMHALRTACYEALRKVVDAGVLPESRAFFANFLTLWDEKGIDSLFRGAPHFVVASSPASAPTPQADCLIALSYFELLANSAGLGTVWDGLMMWLLHDTAPETMGLLDLPEGHQIGYCMAFGKPAVKYHRAISRKGAAIRSLSIG